MSHRRHSSGASKSDISTCNSDVDDEDEPTKETSTQSKPQQEEVQERQQKPHRIVHSIQTLQIPGYFDVLFGRGKPFQEHPGNMRMQIIVERNRERYQKEAKLLKIQVAKEVIDEIRNHDPPVRFLKHVDGDERCKESLVLAGPWYEASDKETLKKIGHCLRAKTPKSVLSLGKTKNQQHSSLTLEMMRHASVAIFPPSTSNPPTGNGTNFLLPHNPNQEKNSPASITSKTQDESTGHGHKPRPHHLDEWSSVTTGGRRIDLVHTLSPHFPHEAEIKPSAKSNNAIGRVGDRSEIDQTSVPGRLSEPRFQRNDDNNNQSNPRVASLPSPSGVSHTAATIQPREWLPICHSDNPEAYETCIKPFNADIQRGSSNSTLPPEQLSPGSLAILSRAFETGPTNMPNPLDSLLNTNNDGGQLSKESRSKARLSSVPELDSLMEPTRYHFMEKDTEEPREAEEFHVIGGLERVDAETRTSTSDLRQESKEMLKSVLDDSLKSSSTDERNNEDNVDKD